MSLVVNTNMAALNAQRQLGKTSSKLAKSIERLSSGLRINSAADDAAGMAIATKMGAQVRGLNQAIRNANNAVTLVQTAEGGINTVTNMLQRLRELAVQSSSDDNTSSDRANLVKEADNLIAELTRIVNTTEYNNMTLLDGQFSGKYFQVGANFSQKITFTIDDTRGKAIGGRAQYSASIDNGVVTAVNENFGAGEIKVNGYDVVATNATDDQYSVLSLQGGDMVMSAAISTQYNLSFIINGTAVAVSVAADAALTANQLATSIVANINAAGITNVTARNINGSQWTIDAKNGANLNLAMTASVGTVATDISTVLNSIGMNNVSTMFGSGGTAAAVNNYNGESSAIAKAAAINAIKADTDVTATALSQSVTGDAAISSGTLAAGDVYINGVDIGAVTFTDSDGTGALVTAINNQTSNTGVTASTDTTGKLILTAADGRNITANVKNNTIDDDLNLSDTGTNYAFIYRSSVQLNDDESFTLTSANSLEDLTGIDTPSISVASNVSTYNVAEVEIDTQANAEAAMLTIDAALEDVNGIRAQIGAVQNRLEFTVANLEISSENMSAAKSQILDADFAAETAIFTRNQIMVQAATAILAQANTLPQLALQLLG